MSGEREAASDGPSVSINVARLPQDGLPIRFEADEAVRAKIAERFGILGVEAFGAELVARRWQKDGVEVRGRLEAEVVQADVVTLEPVRQSVAEDVELFFVPEGSRLARPAAEDGEEIEVELADEEPEAFRGDHVDVGESLVQILGLALDPYPRADGVEFAERREGEKEPSPFAVLAQLRDGKR